MRWKLIVIVSLAATVIASATLCSLVILVFEQFTILGLSESYLLLIPFSVALLAAVFVYRHTARKRKTQAAITLIATLLLTSTACFEFGRWYTRRYFVFTSNKSSERHPPAPLVLPIQSHSAPALT